MKSLIGRKIPDFSLKAFKDGKIIDLKEQDLLGKWGIFFFYPGDFTFVCPTELGDLQDHYAELQKLGVEVYSVSADSAFVHKAWKDASDTIKRIEYTMIGDPRGVLGKALGVLEPDGTTYRGTFLFNPEGEIVLYEVNGNGIGRNAEELMRKVQAAQFVAEHGDQVCPAKWKPGDETIAPSLDLVGKI